ncbi:MAG: pirin family protein [Pseudomonadota bacterium]
MIEHRPFSALAGTENSWLKAKMHFAFAGMGRPEHGPLAALQVWNDDEFAPSSGFPLHPHRNVEIVTYVRTGAITHEDSLGNRGRTVAGDVQVISAGTGIRHSEFNAEPIATRLFQIWFTPRTEGGEPRWSSRRFPRAERSARLVTLASGYPADADALPINADARLLGTTLRANETIVHDLPQGRRAYLVPTTGRIVLHGLCLGPRDGAVISEQSQIKITALDDSEIVLVEVA